MSTAKSHSQIQNAIEAICWGTRRFLIFATFVEFQFPVKTTWWVLLLVVSLNSFIQKIPFLPLSIVTWKPNTWNWRRFVRSAIKRTRILWLWRITKWESMAWKRLISVEIVERYETSFSFCNYEINFFLFLDGCVAAIFVPLSTQTTSPKDVLLAMGRFDLQIISIEFSLNFLHFRTQQNPARWSLRIVLYAISAIEFLKRRIIWRDIETRSTWIFGLTNAATALSHSLKRIRWTLTPELTPVGRLKIFARSF